MNKRDIQKKYLNKLKLIEKYNQNYYDKSKPLDDDKEYDPQKLTEVSLPLKIDKKFFKLHDNLFHHLQTEDGTSEFNVITGFKYNGQELIEYDKELIDRDYDTLKSIIEVNSGKSEIVYSWYNYDEKWFT